jgi:hypothetical protein
MTSLQFQARVSDKYVTQIANGASECSCEQRVGDNLHDLQEQSLD